MLFLSPAGCRPQGRGRGPARRQISQAPVTLSVAIRPVGIIFRASRGVGPNYSDSDPYLPPAGEGDRFMWITPAYAQAAGGGAGGFEQYIQFFPFVAIIAIMYMLLIRPQQKKVKQHQEMVKNLRKGDSVVTSGGTVGRVTKLVDDEQIEIEIAQNVRVRQMRSMVTEVRAKGEPVGSDAADK